MKHLALLGLLVICVAGSLGHRLPANQPAVSSLLTPAPTLSQDLHEIAHIIPTKHIRQLILRYLLNDPEFQAFVRIINSQDAFVLRRRFLAQPEVIAFINWVRTQLLLSGDSFELEDSDEMIDIFNPNPYWSNTVFGWNGFVNEFLVYYPQDMLRAHIAFKIQQNGIFAQFWSRLKALKPVYDRVTMSPEANHLFVRLQAAGIDATRLDHFIRSLFDWVNPPAVEPATTPTSVPGSSAAPVSPEAPVSTVAPASTEAPVSKVDPVATVAPVAP